MLGSFSQLLHFNQLFIARRKKKKFPLHSIAPFILLPFFCFFCFISCDVIMTGTGTVANQLCLIQLKLERNKISIHFVTGEMGMKYSCDIFFSGDEVVSPFQLILHSV